MKIVSYFSVFRTMSTYIMNSVKSDDNKPLKIYNTYLNYS